MRESMAIMIKELQTVGANCNNIEALQGSVTHLRAAITIIKAIQIHKTATNSVLLPKKRYAPNSNMEKQLRFYSTKKTRVTTSRGLNRMNE